MTPRAVLALWSRFSHLYGNRFEVSYGAALTEAGDLQPVATTWANALAGFTGDDLARGLRACLERNDGWPPALPEFIALCRAPAAPAFAAPYHRLFLPAPAQTEEQKAARKAKSRAVLSALRQQLRGLAA